MKDIIDNALKSGINISCFVGDRLPAQVKALNHLHAESIQNKLDDPQYKSVLFVPCTCHVFNRALLNAINQSESLKNTVKLLNSLEVLLRKPVIYSNIKKFMPSLIETRLVYIFDASFWAVKNKKVINSILQLTTNQKIKKYLKSSRFNAFSDGIPDIIEEITKIMIPIKVFFNKLESERATLW